MTDEPDLTEYDKAPVIDEKCEWCGEGEDDEAGPVREFNGGDEIMHSGCMYSYEHGGIRKVLTEAEAAERQVAYDDEWPQLGAPWWENR